MIQGDLLHLDRALTPEERRKVFRNTRTKKHGHAAAPGTGPAGETCKTCKNLVRNYQARTYFKCALYSGKWTGSYGTDVRTIDAACSKWEKPDG